MITYADDITLHSHVSSVNRRQHAADELSIDVEIVSLWCSQLDLQRNPCKSKSLIVSRSRTLLLVH